jgi:hypothetical protein
MLIGSTLLLYSTQAITVLRSLTLHSTRQLYLKNKVLYHSIKVHLLVPHKMVVQHPPNLSLARHHHTKYNKLYLNVNAQEKIFQHLAERKQELLLMLLHNLN